MAAPASEPANLVYHLSTFGGIALLLVLYLTGAWVRSFLLPPKGNLPVWQQLLAGTVVGCPLMVWYAGNVFPRLSTASHNLVFDLFQMVGYAMVMGLLSRETLDRIVAKARAVLSDSDDKDAQ
jgi:hypothetical protein